MNLCIKSTLFYFSFCINLCEYIRINLSERYRKWACHVAPADGTGVEMKNCGLKIGKILGSSSY